MTRLVVASLLALFTIAQADVTREYRASSTVRFMGSNESTGHDYYAGDRHNEVSDVKWTGGFMKTATRGKSQEVSTITRLDKELVWTLDSKKKTYKEMTFEEFREQLKKMGAEGEAEADEEEAEEPESADAYDWTLEDLSDTEPKTLHGWTCRNAHVVVTGIHKQDPNDKVIITLNTWNSEEVPGAAEITDFQSRYLKALGLDELALTPGLTATAQLYAEQMASVLDKAKEATGEPVQSVIEVQHNRRKGKSVGQAAKEGATDALTEKVPFGLGKKKKAEEKPEYVLKTVFKSEREILSASADAVDPSRFEVPEGFKRK